MPLLSDLLHQDQNYIWHPFTPFTDQARVLPVKKAKGSYLYLENNDKILDIIASWWVNLHGHAQPEIAQAIYEQAQKLEQVIFAGFTHEPAIKLSEILINKLVQSKEFGKVFFSDNGSTAVEVGIKMALQYFFNQNKNQKLKIIAFEGAYHGDTFGAMSVGGRTPFNAAFNSLLFKVEFIPIPTKENINALLSTFETLTDDADCAAFIFEPLVQGANGMQVYEAQYLDLLLEIAQKKEIICIADEVMTGFGRTGKLLASHYLKNMPDIICLSKGITGGFLPLGATLCKEKIASAFYSADLYKTFFHGHSYTANPLACVAACKSFEILERESTQKQIEAISKAHIKFVEKLEKSTYFNTTIKKLRCLGTILAIEVNTSEDYSYFNEHRKLIYDFFLERKILMRPLGNVLYLLPPYSTTIEDLHYVYAQIEAFLHFLAKAD